MSGRGRTTGSSGGRRNPSNGALRTPSDVDIVMISSDDDFSPVRAPMRTRLQQNKLQEDDDAAFAKALQEEEDRLAREREPVADRTLAQEEIDAILGEIDADEEAVEPTLDPEQLGAILNEDVEALRRAQERYDDGTNRREDVRHARPANAPVHRPRPYFRAGGRQVALNPAGPLAQALFANIDPWDSDDDDFDGEDNGEDHSSDSDIDVDEEEEDEDEEEPLANPLDVTMPYDIIRSSDFGACTVCMEESPYDPIGCIHCRQLIGCRRCIDHWWAVGLHEKEHGHQDEAPHNHFACPLCRHPWDSKPEVESMFQLKD